MEHRVIIWLLVVGLGGVVGAAPCAAADEPTLASSQLRADLSTDLFALAQADTTVTALTTLPPDEPWAQGTKVALLSGSGAYASSDGGLYQGHVGVGYYFLHGHAINLELAVGGHDGRGGAADGYHAALELMLRSHWLRAVDWSVFLEGGAGVIWLSEPFPRTGTRWNFTPQAGVGFTYRLAQSTHLISGGRWYHISNANSNGPDRNPAYNGLMFYAGLLYEF